MATETKIGQLVIELQMKTQALEKGLETAKKKLQSIEQENKNVENSNKSLDTSYLAMSATAVVALAKIGSAIKDCVNEYNTYTQAMSSLQNVSEYTGESMQNFSKIMDKFGSYMTKSDLATTIKNFSLMGMSAQETEKMIEALTNSAIRNRNANYTVSEAVRVASEGYRQGLSTLSDSAGVTENLSVMLDNYAKSIGKTASQLTEAEKNQAYLNRTMYAAEPFAGAMADYMDTLAGKQGQYSQAMRETQVAFSESLEPTLVKLEELKTNLIKTLGDYIEKNKAGTAGIVSFGIALASLTALIKLAKTAMTLLNTTMLASPVTWIVGALSVLIGVSTSVSTALEEQKNKQEQLKVEQAEYNEVLNHTIELEEERINSVSNTLDDINQYIEKLKEQREIQQSLQTLSVALKNAKPKDNSTEKEIDTYNKLKEAYEGLVGRGRLLTEQLGTQSEHFKKIFNIQKETLLTENDLKETQEAYTEEVKKGNAIKNAQKALDVDVVKGKKREASQLLETAKEHQRLYNIYLQGKKGTKEYEDAVNELSKVFPEAVSATGVLKDEMKDFIDKEMQGANDSYNSIQDLINQYINWLNIASSDPNTRQQIADNLNIPVSELIPKLQTALNLLQLLLGTKSEDMGGVKVGGGVKKTSSSKSYQNKRLDKYKKEIEYKKSLDQISLRDEINMYETALKRYAKTQDEKMELTTKLYELRKELTEKTLDDYTAQIDYEKSMGYISAQQEIERYEYAYRTYAKTFEQKRDLEVKLHDMRQALEEETTQMLKEQADKEREILNQKAEDYKNYIQQKKNLRGAEYDVKEQQADLDEIIKIHRDYLDKLVKDTRYTAEEIESIRREELDTIRDLEQQKRDLMVSSINSTVSQLKSAITKQIEEMEKADEEAIKKNIEAVEKWKDARIDAINEEYDARIKAIQDELDALDKSEQDKTRAEEDAEYEKKRKRLQELAEFEHDAVTKANYLKELAKLEEEYQKTVDKRILADKKEALKEQQDILKEEQTNKTDAIKEEADKQKEQYETQLDNLKEYYDKQKDMAQETAEKMLLNVKDNQEQILSLLNKYGDKYEITGQSLGEKLAQGINNSLSIKIQDIIQKVQDKIDGAIEANIAKWTSAAYKYEQATSKAQVSNKTVVVNQTNNIQQNPEMPSETYRKLRNVDRELAASINI